MKELDIKKILESTEPMMNLSKKYSGRIRDIFSKLENQFKERFVSDVFNRQQDFFITPRASNAGITFTFSVARINGEMLQAIEVNRFFKPNQDELEHSGSTQPHAEVVFRVEKNAHDLRYIYTEMVDGIKFRLGNKSEIPELQTNMANPSALVSELHRSNITFFCNHNPGSRGCVYAGEPILYPHKSYEIAETLLKVGETLAARAPIIGNGSNFLTYRLSLVYKERQNPTTARIDNQLFSQN